MPPNKERTTNFKTFEAQARLLAAVVASLGDNYRLDYKTIAKNYSKDTTESAMEHRLRVVKVHAEAVKEARMRDIDPMKVPFVDYKTKNEIQALFGASTVGGLQWQFRDIKHASKALTEAVEKGQDPVVAFANHVGGGDGATSSVPATPSSRASGTAKRARTINKTTASGSGTTPASKRRKAIIKPDPDLVDDDEDSAEIDYDALDTTPTKIKPKNIPFAQDLVPRESWKKPAPGMKFCRTTLKHVPIAPAPAPVRQETAAYTLVPIPGTSSVAPSAATDGYTNQPNVAGNPFSAQPAMGSDAPSATNPRTTGINTVRRASAAFSVSSGSGGGSYPGSPALTPVTGATPHQDPNSVPAHNSTMGTNQYQPDPASTHSTGMSPFHVFDAASPTASTSEGNTPQTATTSYTVTAAGPTPSAQVSFANTNEHLSPEPPLGSFGPASYLNNYPSHLGRGKSHAEEAAFAENVDMGGWEDMEEFDDAGDV